MYNVDSSCTWRKWHSNRTRRTTGHRLAEVLAEITWIMFYSAAHHSYFIMNQFSLRTRMSWRFWNVNMGHDDGDKRMQMHLIEMKWMNKMKWGIISDEYLRWVEARECCHWRIENTREPTQEQMARSDWIELIKSIFGFWLNLIFCYFNCDWIEFN